MPRGRKPKTYPASMVTDVERLYVDGLTQREIADRLEVTQKIIWRLMLRHGLQARSTAKRDQQGPAHHGWKGDDASYEAFHKRVVARRGRPAACEKCGSTDPSLWYEWANLSGNYADVNDYARMCRSCHRYYDSARRRLGAIVEKARAGEASDG